MNAEFRAYVEAVTDGKCRKSASRVTLGARVVKVLEELGAVLESFGPFYCELRPWHGVRESIAKCCPRREAIGFHGLA